MPDRHVFDFRFSRVRYMRETFFACVVILTLTVLSEAVLYLGL